MRLSADWARETRRTAPVRESGLCDVDHVHDYQRAVPRRLRKPIAKERRNRWTAAQFLEERQRMTLAGVQRSLSCLL